MKPLLKLEKLSVSFPGSQRQLLAVRQLDLDLPQAAVSCLVGESGCGKSLTCRAILRLTPDTASLAGEIWFEGQNLLAISEKALRRIRGAAIGMIFQEPMTSLNPVMTIGSQTAEPLRLHWRLSRKEAKERVIDLFSQVGIASPKSRYNDYPHQLSGGMRQRVMIAMALACKPTLLLADEPTTALDATIQGQILRLIKSQSRERGMAVLLITHDLGVVADIGDFVGVMYGGMLVEHAACRQLFIRPLHPYTTGLMAAAPTLSSINEIRLPTIPGSVPSLGHMPQGCPFQPRCAKAMPICAEAAPHPVVMDGQMVRCWLYAN